MISLIYIISIFIFTYYKKTLKLFDLGYKNYIIKNLLKNVYQFHD